MDWSTSLLVIAVFAVGMVWYSQQRLQNKMLCQFVRPNNMEIERWVPIKSRYVILKTKSGTERYVIVQDKIKMRLYEGGINKLFPVLVPRLRYHWSSELPIDDFSGEPGTWRTPQVAGSAWQGEQFSAFSKGIGQQIQKKGLQGMLPYIIIGGVILLLGIFCYSQFSAISAQVAALAQQLKVR